MAKKAVALNPDLTSWLKLFLKAKGEIDNQTDSYDIHYILRNFETEIKAMKKTLSLDDLKSIEELKAILDKSAKIRNEQLNIAADILYLQEIKAEKELLVDIAATIAENDIKQAEELLIIYSSKFDDNDEINKLREEVAELRNANPHKEKLDLLQSTAVSGIILEGSAKNENEFEF